jgi:chemotaxis protein CheD
MEYMPRIAYVLDDKHTKHYLIPGRIFAAARPFSITSIVGSGVALCLWDSVNKIGGANHFMLPEGPENGENAARYANVANPALLRRMLELGADRNGLEARIFGGSLPGISFGGEGERLGERRSSCQSLLCRTGSLQTESVDQGRWFSYR